jgi:hypothetical protein
MSDDNFEVLDLDAERKTRAAEREGKQRPLPIRFGGEEIAVLPVELPIDVLAPLRNLDGDLTLILRQAMQARNTGQDTAATTDLVVDVLASNPALPVTALDTITKVARNLFTDEGFERLLAQHPSGQDYAALVKGVFRFYGLSLGEASPSSGSSTDGRGATSPGTSSTTSASTPDASGATPEQTTSLEPAAS